MFATLRASIAGWFAPNAASIRNHLNGADIAKALATALATLVALQPVLASLPAGTVPASWSGYLVSAIATVTALLDMARRLGQGADITVENVAVPPGAPPVVHITPAPDQGVTVSPPPDAR